MGQPKKLKRAEKAAKKEVEGLDSLTDQFRAVAVTMRKHAKAAASGFLPKADAENALNAIWLLYPMLWDYPSSNPHARALGRAVHDLEIKARCAICPMWGR